MHTNELGNVYSIDYREYLTRYQIIIVINLIHQDEIKSKTKNIIRMHYMVNQPMLW